MVTSVVVSSRHSMGKDDWPNTVLKLSRTFSSTRCVCMCMGVYKRGTPKHNRDWFYPWRVTSMSELKKKKSLHRLAWNFDHTPMCKNINYVCICIFFFGLLFVTTKCMMVHVIGKIARGFWREYVRMRVCVRVCLSGERERRWMILGRFERNFYFQEWGRLCGIISCLWQQTSFCKLWWENHLAVAIAPSDGCDDYDDE